MKTFLIDVAKCNGCYNCQIACKEEHVGNDWTPYAKPQPDTGQFWMKMNEKVRGTVPKVRMSYVATPCMHCRDARCIASCGPGAIYRREDGLVLIDPVKCTGCMGCLDVCPYGSIYFNRDMSLAQKCTGCAHLLDGGWKEPRCVDACPTGAIRFGEEEELKTLIKVADVLLPEEGTRPLVHYLNLPKRFIAGSIFDPVEDECLEDVRVTLTSVATPARKQTAGEDYCFRGDHGGQPKTGVTLVSTTDDFGDFWFHQIDTAQYVLKIEKERYVTRTIEAIDVSEKDVNLGDIDLQRAR
jgi:Fe-S-cluster-containing dehydrogenase component